MQRVLVIGSINMDVTIFADRMPSQGETLSGHGFMLSPGGKGANQAVAAARMGADTSFVGCVGGDVFGQKLMSCLQADGIDAGGLRVVEGISTGVAVILVTGGDNRIILHNGANEHVRVDAAGRVAAAIEQSDALLMQLEIPHDTVYEAARMAHARGKRVFLTPAPAVCLPPSLFAHVDYLLPNENEAGLLLGRPLASDADMLGALIALRDMGAREPVITLGARGVACFIAGRPTLCPGYRVDAVDTTAAGDTFTGAFATAIIRGMPMAQAVSFAQKAAALCVTRPGAQNAIPTLPQVESADLPGA